VGLVIARYRITGYNSKIIYRVVVQDEE